MKHYSDGLFFSISNLFNFKTGFVSIISGVAGAVINKVYGGGLNPIFIGLLTITICFDWVGAIASAKKDGSYASQYGINGVLRTAVMITMPAWGNLVDNALSTPGFFFFLLTGGLLFHTMISMTANFKRAGWDKWIPIWALEWIASEIEAKIKRSESRITIDKKGDGMN